jgi:hypothetical protein
MNVLGSYEQASGQRLNKEKTSIFFSQNTVEGTRQQILQASGVQATNNFEKYLGLLAIVKRSRRMALSFVTEKVWSYICYWKNKFLSQARNEILIKAVAQAIHTNTISMSRLSKDLIREINAMM